MIKNDQDSNAQIQLLASELKAFKRAFNDLDAELQREKEIKQEAEKQREFLESQLKVRELLLIVLLVVVITKSARGTGLLPSSTAMVRYFIPN